MIRPMRSWSRTALVCLATLVPASLPAAVRPPAPAKRATARGAMVRIPAGSYRPLYAPPGVTRVQVHAFALDRTPVTRSAYLRFVRANPQWARGSVQSRLADAGYLADWPSASSAGDAADLERPVTGVSWYAAKAYCTSQGKRLPAVDEWELAAAASETKQDASGDPAFRRRLSTLYAARRGGVPPMVRHTSPNLYGVSDLHGVVWEWTSDFNATATDHEHHAGRHDAHAVGRDKAAARHLYCASSAIGATDPTDYPAFVRYAVRSALTASSTTSGVGFRCAADQVV
ncbi:MAG TPA: formylglycine-generating enzyme family protein [Gemmatimonadaceae bacterium]|nr:formylglycine-generating enzyme family protein [Gemmatimonadaceae bacterium]